MPGNELILLDELLAQRAQDATLPDDEAFELFACEFALRGLDISGDEIANGVVGGGNDGGIDGVYVFLADALLQEDSEVLGDDFATSKVSPGSKITLRLVQAKREESFSETALDKISSSAGRLLDLAITDEELLGLYSPSVVSAVGVFRDVLQRLAARHPVVEIQLDYATRGDISSINAKVAQKARDLEKQFAETMSDAVGSVEFLGASELWKLASSIPSYTLQLPYEENATSGTGHVAIVSLEDYLAFLTDDDGKLRRHIFDWNVRDYEGAVEVNREIQRSLDSPDSPEFWWLNNGVTLICSKTSIVGKTYVLDDVQIVNGLQTSHTLFRVLSAADGTHPAMKRRILVRILVTDEPSGRDAVIRATNRQTSVTAASLRATDDVQRSIETFFLSAGWFYDRRKNYYRNLGKNPARIIGIPLLAQAVMAAGLSEPDNSRARPSSLLKRDDDYGRIFSDRVKLPVYLWIARLQKAVDTFLLAEGAATSAPERTNLRFHMAMLAAARQFGSSLHAPAQLAQLADKGDVVSDEELLSCLNDLRKYFEAFKAQTGDSADKIAKGRGFVDYVLTEEFPGK